MEFLPDGAVYMETAEVPMFLASAFLKVFAIFYPRAIEIAREKFFVSLTAETKSVLSVVVRLFRVPTFVLTSFTPVTTLVFRVVLRLVAKPTRVSISFTADTTLLFAVVVRLVGNPTLKLTSLIPPIAVVAVVLIVAASPKLVLRVLVSTLH
jgi:hypothetical protein